VSAGVYVAALLSQLTRFVEMRVERLELSSHVDPNTTVVGCQVLNNKQTRKSKKLESGSMPIAMAALWNIGDSLCSTPQSLADGHYLSAVQ